MSTKNWIAILIVVVGIIGIIAGFLNDAFGDPVGSVLTFSALQVFWLGVLWGVVGLILLIFLPDRAPEPTIDVTQVDRLETQVRGYEGRLQDFDNRFQARLGDFDTRVKTLEATPKAFAKLPVNDDELEVLEGVGPKFAAALRAAGIDTFTKLANSTESELRAAIESAGMSFAPSIPTWARQAQYLVNGDWEGFQEYVRRLTAGRDA
ncbi:MAG: hypothetical protein IT320_18195 [Anaerolineae bacterium]|nr:hypothetical protein [Anaerolineae bacterium]